MIAKEVSMTDMSIKIQIEGEPTARESLRDPMVKRIDKMGRVYIDRDLAERPVTIVVMPLKEGDKERWMKIGRK